MAAPAKVRPFAYTAIAVLLFADLALLIYMVSPLRPRAEEKVQQLQSAEAQLKRKQVEVAPLQGMDQKLKDAQSDLNNFYKTRLADRESVIAGELGKLAGASGVQLSGARYELKSSTIPGLQQLAIDATLEGQYLNVVKFINGLERDKLFFILDGINLQEQQGGTIRLVLTMETFLRS
jgi:hypothetical protein